MDVDVVGVLGPGLGIAVSVDAPPPALDPHQSGRAPEAGQVPEVYVDSQGQIFVADQGNGRVRRIAVDGTITTVAGDGDGDKEGPAGDGVAGTQAKLTAPNRLAVDKEGNVLIADAGQGRIRKLSRSGRLTTIAETKLVTPSTMPVPPPSTTPPTITTTTTLDPYGVVFVKTSRR